MDINALSVGREFRPIPTRRETMKNQLRALFHRVRQNPQVILLDRPTVERVDGPWDEFGAEILRQLVEQLGGLADSQIERCFQRRTGGENRPHLIAAHLPNQNAISLYGDWAEDELIITHRYLPSLSPQIH